jgi:hypothetical protein
MKTLALLLPSFFFSLFLNAQDAEKPSFFKPYSAEITIGLNVSRDQPLSLEEMMQLAPTSELLTRNYTNYNGNGHVFYSSSSYSVLNAKVQFLPYNKKKNEHQRYCPVHIGFSYGKVELNGPTYSNDQRFRIDTLYANNGTQYFMDSVYRQSAQFSWSEKLIGLDIGQTFHTDDKRIFSCWMGYGIQLAMGVDGRFQGYYSESAYTSIRESYNPNTNIYTSYSGESAAAYSNIEGKTETIRTKSVFVPRIYFPLGLQFRFSRKENALNKLALTAEARMNMDIQPVPNSVTLTRFTVNQTIGLKYYFDYNISK